MLDISKECCWLNWKKLQLIYVCGQTCTYIHKWKRVSGLWSLTTGSGQACFEWSLLGRRAFLIMGSANIHEERANRAGPLWLQSQVCLNPVPSTGDVCCFLITTVPMATPLCWLCFEHKLILAVCSVSPSVDQMAPVTHFKLCMQLYKTCTSY